MVLAAGYDIAFVNLGIEIQHIVNGFMLPIFGGFEIKYYGLIIGIGVLAGMFVAERNAKAAGLGGDVIYDFGIYAVIFSVLGARIYYVIFSWDMYKDDLIQVFNIRNGGLAIYGAVIAAVSTLFIFCKIKKLPALKLGDCCIPGLILGQAIGRWGNFVNCEVFGGYTDNLFAMQIRRSLADPAMVSQELLNHLVVKGGVEYIQVHPTFLYESVWDLCVFIILMWVFYQSVPSGRSGSNSGGGSAGSSEGKSRKAIYRKKFDGEIMCLYFILYGIGRFVIEGIRVDQLMLFSTGIAVSQLLSAVMVITAAGIVVWKRRGRKNA